MKNKGFTLVELLAVITILAIIALISTPIILNITKQTRENAFIRTCNSIVTATRNYQMEKEANNVDAANLTINFPDDADFLDLRSGKVPDGGTVKINDKGQVQLRLWQDQNKICAVKSDTDKKVKIDRNIAKANCKL